MMNELQKVIESFAFDGEVVKTEPFVSGHINETLLLTSKKNTQYIL